MIPTIALGCLSLGSTGCAFLFKGSSQSVAFDSDPQGADVNNNGNYLGPTPSTAEIHRTGISNIKVSKDGYAETYVHLDRTADIPWFFWDLLSAHKLRSSNDPPRTANIGGRIPEPMRRHPDDRLASSCRAICMTTSHRSLRSRRRFERFRQRDFYGVGAV